MAKHPGSRDQPAGKAAGGDAPHRVVVVTGMSGAGKTVALKALEDMGYEAVDNLPLSLVRNLVGPARRGQRPLAIGVDIRTRGFGVEPFLAEIDALERRADTDVSLLFLDCEDEVLRRRYSETRHRHPLAGDLPLTDSIRQERTLLAPLRERAGHVIDTSRHKLGDLKRQLEGICALTGSPGLAITVMSFSYRLGLPPESDIVLDVRFLANPHYEPTLARLSGRDPAVAAFVETDPGFVPFFAALTGMLDALLPRFSDEGKSYLTIAIGCTGGMHRSVFVAESLAAWLDKRGHGATLAHRDLGRALGVE